REGQTPGAEEAFQRLELALCKDVSEPARSAVAEEGDVIVAQAEHLGGATHFDVVGKLHDLAFPEVVATPVGTQLGHLVFKAGEAVEGAHFVEALVERRDVAIVADMRAVLAALRPLWRDAESLADTGARPLGA